MSCPGRAALWGPGTLPSHWHLLTQNRGNQGGTQHGQQARNMHRETQPSPGWVRWWCSPHLSLHQTRQEEAVIKISFTNLEEEEEEEQREYWQRQYKRQTCTPVPALLRNQVRQPLFAGLVSWLACLFVLIIVPRGFLLVHLLGFKPWSFPLELFFHKL